MLCSRALFPRARIIQTSHSSLFFTAQFPRLRRNMALKTLGAKAAAALDQELMSTGAFSIDQLMELAGLSVSQAGTVILAWQFGGVEEYLLRPELISL
jgi:hypothetical protein